PGFFSCKHLAAKRWSEDRSFHSSFFVTACRARLPVTSARARGHEALPSLQNRRVPLWASAHGKGNCSFLSFTIAIHKIRCDIPREQGELYQLLHDINDTIIVRRRPHAPRIVELLVRLGYRRLIGYCQHPHPAAQQAHL